MLTERQYVYYETFSEDLRDGIVEYVHSLNVLILGGLQLVSVCHLHNNAS